MDQGGETSGDVRIARIAGTMACVAVLLGAWARMRVLRQAPMWLDEAYSRFAAEHGWWFLWHVVPAYETHPPLYYSLLHLWRGVAGDSLLAYRLPGLLCGLATIAVTGIAARALADRIGVARPERMVMIGFALGFAALSPMLIVMSQQVRPYPVMILVYAIATLGLLRLESDAAARRPLSRRWIPALFGCQAMMLWLHTLGPLFGLAIGLALLLCVARRDLGRSDWTWLAAGQLAAGLLYLPGFAIMLSQARGWVRSTWLVFDPRHVPGQLGELFGGPWLPLGLFAALAFAGGMAQFPALRRGARLGAALMVLAVLPVLLSLLLSWWIAPVFLPRTLSPAVIPFALGIAMLGAHPRLRLVASVLIAMLLALMLRYDFDGKVSRPMEEWYRTADWILPRIAPGDAVWAYPNETALPLGYALEDQHRALAIRQIPAPVPAIGVPGDHRTGNGGVVALTHAQIAAIAADPATARPRTIWLVGLAAERLDPGDRLVAALLRDRTITQHYAAGEIRILALTRRPAEVSPGRGAPAAAAAAR